MESKKKTCKAKSEALAFCSMCTQGDAAFTGGFVGTKVRMQESVNTEFSPLLREALEKGMGLSSSR